MLIFMFTLRLSAPSCFHLLSETLWLFYWGLNEQSVFLIPLSSPFITTISRYMLHIHAAMYYFFPEKHNFVLLGCQEPSTCAQVKWLWMKSLGPTVECRMEICNGLSRVNPKRIPVLLLWIVQMPPSVGIIFSSNRQAWSTAVLKCTHIGCKSGVRQQCFPLHRRSVHQKKQNKAIQHETNLKTWPRPGVLVCKTEGMSVHKSTCKKSNKHS